MLCPGQGVLNEPLLIGFLLGQLETVLGDIVMIAAHELAGSGIAWVDDGTGAEVESTLGGMLVGVVYFCLYALFHFEGKFVESRQVFLGNMTEELTGGFLGRSVGGDTQHIHHGGIGIQPRCAVAADKVPETHLSAGEGVQHLTVQL